MTSITPRPGPEARPQPAVKPQILRDYQIQAIEDLREKRRLGFRAPVLVSPTGSGKTVIAGEIIRSARLMGKRILFLAHRKELIEQASRRLDNIGVPHGIIKSNHPRRRPWEMVHVCSVRTLVNRQVDAPDLIFIDECHRAPGPSYQKILARYPNAVCIGLTATPCRTDGKGLNELFDCMVQCPSPAEMIERGYLVPFRIFAPPAPDLAGIRTTGGDYQKDELAHVVDKSTLTGDIVQHYLKSGENRIALAFAVNILHSQHIAEQFRTAGIAAEHVDGTMPDAQREGILARLEKGITRVVTNVDVFCEGTDIPAVSAIILARPTQSLRVFLQQCGRGARLFPGKRDCIIFDHAGNTFKRLPDGTISAVHGAPDDPREWSLDGVKKRGRNSEVDPALAVRMCLQCWAAFSSKLAICPMCGWQYVGKNTQPEVVEGELEEITSENRPKYPIQKLSKNPVIAMLQIECEEKNWKPGKVHFLLEEIEKTREEMRIAGTEFWCEACDRRVGVPWVTKDGMHDPRDPKLRAPCDGHVVVRLHDNGMPRRLAADLFAGEARA